MEPAATSAGGRPGARPPLAGIYETVLYAPDLEAARRFYGEVLGFRLVEEIDGLAVIFRLPDGGVLLVFDPAAARQPGRPVPSHGAAGPGHVAFAVPAGALAAWRDHLAATVEVERDVDWDDGTGSLYVRDPAGNSVELAEGELWPV